jgi:hypothetical protein
MSLNEWRTSRWRAQGPKCILCDVATEPTIIFRGEDYSIRGWRCPNCGFTYIHPDEIPKALELQREVTGIT